MVHNFTVKNDEILIAKLSGFSSINSERELKLHSKVVENNDAMKILKLNYILLFLPGFVPSLRRDGSTNLSFFCTIRFLLFFLAQTLFVFVPTFLYMVKFSKNIVEVLTSGISLIGVSSTIFILFYLMFHRKKLMRIFDQIELIIAKSEDLILPS